MTTDWGTTGLYEAPARTPVILPLRSSKPEQWRKPTESPADRLMRFAIPDLSAPTAAEPSRCAGPVAVWPSCPRPEVVQACAEAAETIYRRMSPNGSTIIALASPGDGAGTTSAAIGLAPELAKRVEGILAVDADFLKPDLSMQLDLSGLNIPAGAKSLIYPTNRSGLSVLPNSGGAPSWNREWFEALRDRWKAVLLDMPSLSHAEPAPLIRYCDGVYLVVRLGYTARRAVAESDRAIRARGGRLLGSIVIG